MSDNASTYLAAADELQQLLDSTSLKEALGGHGMTWQFIPKRAPWYGGYWERLVGLTKQALKAEALSPCQFLRQLLWKSRQLLMIVL